MLAPVQSAPFARREPAAEGASVTETDESTAIHTQQPTLSLLPASQPITILGEVVSAYGLIRDETLETEEDSQSYDDLRPFARVHYGDTHIHHTSASIEAGRNPIWTISARSLFLVHTTPQDLLDNNNNNNKPLEISIWFHRKDPLQIATLETVCLGKAVLTGAQILEHCDEERLVVDLYDDVEDWGSRGSVTLRFRLATPSDEAFLRAVNRNYELHRQTSITGLYEALSTTTTHGHGHPGDKPEEKAATAPPKRPKAFLPTEEDETTVAGTSFVNALSSAFTSKKYYDREAGMQKIRVKPHPDPDRVEETTYLSHADFKSKTMAPSKEWVEAGSGTLGKMHLEILYCQDLPNVDVGETMGNLTDAFICAVFEDTMVQTPVIDDELSPHWLPWTQRAFVIGMMHPASMLYLGCFDYDLGLSDHEAIGRVAVNTSNLQRDTDYTLTYNLYPSSNVTERKAIGTITIRLRIEYFDEKQAVLAALQPRPKFHVNVQREKSLKVVHYTCFGEYGDESEEKFDLTVTRSYINEILQYRRHLSYAIGDGLRSLIFWRGQVRVFGIMLPVHSFLFFCSSLTLVERPYLLPSFWLLSVAWVMMATGTQRQQHPSPWYRCPSFWQYVEVLRTGRSSLRIRNIKSREGSKATDAYDAAWNERVAKDLDAATKRAEMKKQLDDMGSEQIHTKMVAGNVIPIELLGRLARYQGMIGRCCRKFRLIKIILTWEESILSFWITACFLAAGLISLILPWAFILTWLGRIVVWGLLGPHMKIVDAYLQTNKGDEKVLEKAMERFNQQSLNARVRYQEALKLKDMKCFRFGKFITAIPNFNLGRHYDRPLATSFARVHKKGGPIQIAPQHVPGQQFFGRIVPRTQEETKEFALLKPELEILLERLVHTIRFRQQENKLRNETGMPNSIHYELMANETDSASHLQLSSSASAAIDQTAQVAILSFREQRTLRSSMRIGFELVPMTLEAHGEQGDGSESAVDPSTLFCDKLPLVRDASSLFSQRHDSVSESIRYPLTALARDWEDYWAVTDEEEQNGQQQELGAPTTDDAVEVVLSCLETDSLVENDDKNDSNWIDEKKEGEHDDDNVDGDVDGDETTEGVGLRRRPKRQSLHVVLYRQD